MKISIIGTRGIPANYGGFETFAQELAIRLVRRGHHVTVYGRSHYIDRDLKQYQGVNLTVLPTIKHKYLDTVFHTGISICHALFGKYDVILVCNAANSLFCWIPRIFGTAVPLNVDGLEWKRKKWNALGRAHYKLSERVALWSPTALVSDARDVQRYYKEKYRKDTTFIAYGSRTLDQENTGTDVLEQHELEPGKYLLYVSRLEPENNALAVVKAFEEVKTDMKLAIVGSAPYAEGYIRELHSTKDPRIVFTGGVFGSGYLQLLHHAYFFIQASEVGGTHPALLESMGAGNCILFNDVPEHREVVGGTGVPFDISKPGDLRDQLQFLVDNPEQVRVQGQKAREIVRKHYSWDGVVDKYEKLFRSMLDGSHPRTEKQ